MTCAGRIQVATDLFDSGMLCKCPSGVRLEESPSANGDEVLVHFIKHRTNCEGRDVVLSLISMEPLNDPT